MLTGIVLVILVVFIIDHVGDESGSRDIVNWGFIGEKIGASLEKAGEEIRQESHEATEPEKTASPPPGPPATIDEQ